MALCCLCYDRFTSSEACRQLLFNPSRLEYQRSHSSLQESAGVCPLCRVLLDFDAKSRLGRRRLREEALEDDLLFVFQLDTSPGTLIITQPRNVFAGTLEFTVMAEEDDPLGESVSRRNTVVDRGTNSKFSLLKSWIKDCDNDHEVCALPASNLPTRVVDVSSAPDSLRVIVTGGQRAPYVALSYCWGDSQPVVTTSETIREHCEHLSYYSLPASIRDAVKTTRCLGLKYLWIDSLCIIQDSVEDKEKEMALMQQVFQDSYLTIVAACASSSAQGFLRLGAQQSSLLSIPVRCRNGLLGSMLLYEKSKEAEREPLHERAWTLQEVFLSPRLIIYGRAFILWKCLYRENVDTGSSDWNGYCASSGLTTIRLSRSGQIIRPRLSTFSADIGSFQASGLAESLPELFRIWKQVVKDYSVRKLTNPEDKLPALSGIVTYFQRNMRDRYLAGLWEKHILHELAWEVLDGHRPNVWRAPSWSWMSLDGALSFRADRCEWFTPMARVLRCRTVPVISSAPFSRLSSGFIRITGYLRPNVPKFPDRQYPFARPNEFLHEGKFGEIVLDAKDEVGDPTGTEADTSPLSPVQRIYWCLMVAKCFTYATFSRDEELTETIWGLALTQKEDDTFERVGYFLGNQESGSWFEEKGDQEVIQIV